VYGPGTFERSLEDIISGQMKYSMSRADRRATLPTSAPALQRSGYSRRFTVETINLNPLSHAWATGHVRGERFVYYGTTSVFNLYNGDSDREMNDS
jgi:hypothetical protein